MFCELQNVTKQYNDITPIHRVSLSIDHNDYISISGESGAGKSTLLFLIGGMLTPDSGDILLNGQAYSQMDDNQLSTMRSAYIGYVSQNIQLLQALTVEENIAFAKTVAARCGFSAGNLPDTDAIIDYLGLKEKRGSLPCHLSGGQKRRAMIAVTWARNPRMFLLDEPTNDLDPYWSDRMMALFDQWNQDGKAIVLVTHNRQYAMKAKKQYQLINGALTE